MQPVNSIKNKSKNYIINGAMDYWQRNTTFTSVVTNTYVADRFVYDKVGTMVHTITRDTDVPTLAQAGFVFPYSMRLNLTTPDTSIAATDDCRITQKIEGQVFAPLAAKTTTLSFWVKATLAGTYPVSFRNSANDRSYVTTFVINTSNTWERKTITLTQDQSGTWLYDTGIGLRISISLAGGTSVQAPALNTWLSGNFTSHSSCVNGVNTGATDFKITGIQLEEGQSASNFERAGGNALNELSLCQRYFQILNVYRRRINGTILFDGADIIPMRVYPTLSNGSIIDNGSLQLNSVTQAPFNSLYFQGTVAATAGGVHQVSGDLDAEL